MISSLEKIQIRIKAKAFLFINSIFDNVLRSKKIGLSVATRELSSFQKSSFGESDLNEWCLILHGKIYDEKFLSYLIHNLRSLREFNKSLSIVVSTYGDSNYSLLEHVASELDVTLLLAKDVGALPKPFPRSLGQQISSFRVGLDFAIEQRYKYVVKLRVDQMLNPDAFFSLALCMFKLLPPLDNQFSTRIWSTSYNTYKYRTLGISDMLMFGCTEVISDYWENMLPKEILEFNANESNAAVKDKLYGFTIPETWLAYRFIRKHATEVNDISKLEHEFWGKFAGIVNANAIGFDWGKSKPWLASNFHSINWFGSIYSNELAELTFEEWLYTY